MPSFTKACDPRKDPVILELFYLPPPSLNRNFLVLAFPLFLILKCKSQYRKRIEQGRKFFEKTILLEKGFFAIAPSKRAVELN